MTNKINGMAASVEEFKTTTASGLAGIVKAGQELTTQAEKIAPAVLEIGTIGKDARAAFKEMTEVGKTEITQIGDATKSKIEATLIWLRFRQVNIVLFSYHFDGFYLD